jgi:RNA recognition motif-containing protein
MGWVHSLVCAARGLTPIRVTLCQPAAHTLSERLTMSSKIYVGNLPYSIDDQSLRHNFSEHGNVVSAKVMMDRDSGRSKGFGFVEMSGPQEAEAASAALNGMAVGSRAIVVNISRPKEPGTGFGSGGAYREQRRSY